MQPTPVTPGELGARHDGFPPSSATPCAVPRSGERGRAGPFRDRKGEHSGLEWATEETSAAGSAAQGETGTGARGRPLDARAGSADVSTSHRPACVARPEARPQRETDGSDAFADRRCAAHRSAAAPMLSSFCRKRRLDGSSSFLWCELDQFLGCSALARRWTRQGKGNGRSGARRAGVDAPVGSVIW